MRRPPGCIPLECRVGVHGVAEEEERWSGGRREGGGRGGCGVVCILISKLTGKYLKICPKIEKFDFLLLTLQLVGRLDLTKTSSNSSFSYRLLKVLKPDLCCTV